jgi:hypothetical protein
MKRTDDKVMDHTVVNKRKYLIDCQTDKNVLDLPGNNSRQSSYRWPIPDSRTVSGMVDEKDISAMNVPGI